MMLPEMKPSDSQSEIGQLRIPNGVSGARADAEGHSGGFQDARREPAHVAQISAVEEGHSEDIVPFWTSCRMMQCYIALLGSIVSYTMRINFSMAIVCMVKDSDDMRHVQVSVNKSNNLITFVTDPPHEDQGSFVWSKQTEGNLLAAFFWGYILTQVPAGWLARKYNPKLIIMIGMTVSAITTFLSVPAANAGPTVLWCTRFINGCGEGVYFPTLYSLWANWTPPFERSRVISFTETGIPIGNIITFTLTGFICDQIGWHWSFYIFGVTAILWLVCVYFCLYNSPDDHPRITATEWIYIKQSLLHSQPNYQKEDITVPWGEILFSYRTVSVYFAHFCSGWGAYVMLTALPQYMDEIMHMEIAKNGVVNALPHLCNGIVSVLGCIAADCLLSRSYVAKTNLRKGAETVQFLLGGLFIGIVGFLGRGSASWVVFLICMEQSCSAFHRFGLLTTILEMAPRFSSIIMGISNTCGNIPGALAPMVVGAITTDGSLGQWHTVFWMTSGIYLVGWLSFTLFSTSEVQPWAFFVEETQMQAVSQNTEAKDTDPKKTEKSPLLFQLLADGH